MGSTLSWNRKVAAVLTLLALLDRHRALLGAIRGHFSEIARCGLRQGCRDLRVDCGAPCRLRGKECSPVLAKRIDIRPRGLATSGRQVISLSTLVLGVLFLLPGAEAGVLRSVVPSWGMLRTLATLYCGLVVRNGDFKLQWDHCMEALYSKRLAWKAVLVAEKAGRRRSPKLSQVRKDTPSEEAARPQDGQSDDGWWATHNQEFWARLGSVGQASLRQRFNFKLGGSSYAEMVSRKGRQLATAATAPSSSPPRTAAAPVRVSAISGAALSEIDSGGVTTRGCGVVSGAAVSTSTTLRASPSTSRGAGCGGGGGGGGGGRESLGGGRRPWWGWGHG